MTGGNDGRIEWGRKPTRMRILVVEDNRKLARSISQGLSEGHSVECTWAGVEAVSRVARGHLDLVILDLGLPDLDGIEVLGAIRSKGIFVPILVLTARDAVEDRVRALDLGADDYLVKPFAFSELVARVNALSRRAAGPRWSPLSAGDLRLDTSDPMVEIGGARVALSPKEHGILVYLVRRLGEVVPRADILREVFGYEFDPGTNLIDVHVGHIRKKIAASRVRIETVRGVGFRAMLEESR